MKRIADISDQWD